MINYIYNNKTYKIVEELKTLKILNKIASDNNKKCGDINYIFCSKKYILKINKQYLNHDYYTDIITFNYNEGNIINADIFVCISIIKSNAKEFHIDLKKELMRVIFHGLLHLVGYDDLTEKDTKEMRKQEEKYL